MSALAVVLRVALASCSDSADAGVPSRVEAGAVLPSPAPEPGFEYAAPGGVRLLGFGNTVVAIDASRCIHQLWRFDEASVAFSVTSTWTAVDGGLTLLLLESGPSPSWDRMTGQTTVIGVEPSGVRTVTRLPTRGVVLHASKQHGAMLLGAGRPLVYSRKSGRFEAVKSRKPRCPGRVIPGDDVAQLHEVEPRTRVVFREWVELPGAEVELVGIEGDALSVKLVVVGRDGLCLRSQWLESCGGNGGALEVPPSPLSAGRGLSLEATCFLRPTTPGEPGLSQSLRIVIDLERLRIHAEAP